MRGLTTSLQINRQVLDFDFEKLCSVSLSNINVYACLVCGKFYQGRGKSSPAYAHALNDDHHVFIHLNSLEVWILPDLYKADDPSLADIRYLLRPTFKPDQLQLLAQGQGVANDLARKEYLPGFIGLNNISATSHMNAVLQALLHVIPLRDYFIINSQNGAFDNKSELVQKFAMLCRTYWSPKLFKAQVSPHEFVQEVVTASGRQFRVTEAGGDPLEFLEWLLNALHRDLGGNKRERSSVISAAFQGIVRVQDQAVLTTRDEEETVARPQFDLSANVVTNESPFLLLRIDLPAPPVFQDAIEKNIVPQVPLSTVLDKYNGETTQNIPAKGLRRYKIAKLPPLLILHFKRFTTNNFVEEKNPTVVNYPVRGVDMSECAHLYPLAACDVAILTSFFSVVRADVDSSEPASNVYDLVANITHEATAGTAREDSIWKAHVHNHAPPGTNANDERWFRIQDLIVEEINKQTVFLGDTYIQVCSHPCLTTHHAHFLKYEHRQQIWQRRAFPGEPPINVNPDPKQVSQKVKSTKAKMAKNAPTPEELARQQRSNMPGVKMGKLRKFATPLL